MKLLRLDMDKLTVQTAEQPASYMEWWGRGLIAKVLLEEMDATADPLGPGNVLIFTQGAMPHTGFSSSGRLSVGGKSPLTGGIKEANAGGNVAGMLVSHGLKAIIVKGKASGETPYLLEIREDGYELKPCPELAGLGCYQQADMLHARYGAKAGLLITGPAADMHMSVSGVVATDKEGVPTRVAARGGLGAVMRSKGLKAVVVMPPANRARPADPAAVKATIAELNKVVLSHPTTGKVFPEQGTASVAQTLYDLGGLPTRNFSHGSFEEYDKITGIALANLLATRKPVGIMGHTCMSGCLVRCSNVFASTEGKEVVRGMEYETMVLFGSNLGHGNLDWVARFNWICNDLGVDTVEVGAAIGVAMDAGLMKFGDGEAIENALNEMRHGTVLGRLLGAGATTTGRVLGHPRVPSVKGQAMPAYDPRAIKGMGVTYATCPQGADHTAGHTLFFKVDHHSPEGQVAVSRHSQIMRAAQDTLGLCAFLISATMHHPDKVMALVNGALGTSYTTDDFERIGKDCLRMEREFNRRAGFTAAHDRLPEFMRTEKLPPHNVVFDVPEEELDQVFNF